ncbi:ABC transporter ATP-binding protein, partial [Escherichia coli]|uniref:ABC transporter transmembrane domain-containing protein n=1 Tax=Escherichia coli TaxID=562 RepID=UPI0013F84160
TRFLEDSSFLREYIYKYRRWVGFGLAALITVDLLEIIPPLLLKSSIDRIVAGRPWQTLIGFAAGYFALAIGQGFCRYAWRIYLIRSSMFAGRDLRARFTQHMFGLSKSFFDRQRIGDLMSLATNDTDAIRMAIGAGLLTFADALFY